MCKKVIFLLLMVGFFSPLVYPASFDCSKAGTDIEHLICDNTKLSLLDEELAMKYQAVMNLLDSDAKEALKKAQRDWLKRRNRDWKLSEGDGGLIADYYITRSDHLMGIIDLILKPEEQGITALDMSKNEQFQKVLSILSKDEKMHLSFYHDAKGFWTEAQCKQTYQKIISGQVMVIEPKLVSYGVKTPKLQALLSYPPDEMLSIEIVKPRIRYIPEGKVELYMGEPAFKDRMFMRVEILREYSGHLNLGSHYYMFNLDRSLQTTFKHGRGEPNSGKVDWKNFNPSFLIDVDGQPIVVDLDYITMDKVIMLTIKSLSNSDNFYSACAFTNY